MPLDSSSSSKASGSNAANAKISKQRTSRLSSLIEDMCPVDEAPFRARLHLLFSQIEKEFELLYLENLNCKYNK